MCVFVFLLCQTSMPHARLKISGKDGLCVTILATTNEHTLMEQGALQECFVKHISLSAPGFCAHRAERCPCGLSPSVNETAAPCYAIRLFHFPSKQMFCVLCCS